ncbi:MAG TPA: hypothetical protein VHZ55_28450 [Bryobacteraceae bacterium]|nr:hypothetical protein [Bryobacteraceae bacterium]
MSAAIDQGARITRGKLVYIPVVPGKIEFALHVRRTLLELRPGVVAVELPQTLDEEYLRAAERLPKMSVILLADEDDGDEEQQPLYLPVETGDPFMEAVRTAREIGSSILFLDLQPEQSEIAFSYPASYSAELIGLDRYVDAYRLHGPSRTEELRMRAAATAWKLQGGDPLATTCVVVSLASLDPLLDAMEMPQEEPPLAPVRLFRRSKLCNLHPDCLAEVTMEIPNYQQRYEQLRTGNLAEAPVDRPRWQLDLLREAEAEYAVNTGERMQSWHRVTLAKFARNLALLDRDLLPGAYDLTLAARSIVDDNYGYEVWEMANRYSVQETEDEELETVKISGEEVWTNTRRLRIRRRLPRMKQRMRPAGLQKRKREATAGDWAKQTDGNSICSYPPEDLVIESYGKYLKQHAKSVLEAEASRVEPFLASTRDGIDLRETVRNWHEGRLYVRDSSQASANIGALVIIFDEDPTNRYRYLTTWLGEHQNESDMAFYSTEPFDHLVGPGVGRAEYGGLLMTLPPRRLYDVWSDPDYDGALTKAERLLMAALDYSIEPHVAYIAAKPPRSLFRAIAARVNRKIIYIPIGQLSPTKVKKIRVVHVLDSYARRRDAKQYIW